MPNSRLVVTRVAQLSAITALHDEWAALHDASESTNPFSGPEWASLWFERFLGPTDEAWLLEVRDEGELVALLPLYRRTSRLGPALMQSPGTAAPWIGPFELPSPVALPKHARPALRAAVEFLVAHGERWDWADITLGDVAPWFEPEWLPCDTGVVVPRRGVSTVVLPLGEDADSGAGSRRNLKESVRRARNRLTRAYGAEGWEVRRVTDAAAMPAAFDRLAELHGSRARRKDKRVHGDALDEPQVSRYVRDVVVAMAGRGRASIYELVADGSVITSQLVLATSTSSYFSLSGMTPAAWEFSPVTYLQWLAVDDAKEAGHVEMNMSAGPNQTKLRWTRHVRSYREFVVVSQRPRSRALFRAAAALAALREFDEAIRAQRPAPASPATPSGRPDGG